MIGTLVRLRQQATVSSSSARRRWQLPQHTCRNQYPVGFAIDDLRVAQHVPFEQLEQHQLYARPYTQALPGFEKAAAQGNRVQGVALLRHMTFEQRLQAQAQLL